tara:strand:- start:1033 stop:4017 length:2985 start_codon:yes stop_codon:yes gene_type:complete
MEGYIQNQLLEVNQATSEEARTNNTENPAEFTNTFSDVIILQPGDKISLQSSFIAERGSGNTKTIELKGKSLGVKKSFTITSKSETIHYPSKITTSIIYTQQAIEKELFDNKANIVLNYYKNMNGTGYVGLPRHFILNNSPSSVATSAGPRVWGEVDDEPLGYRSPVPDFDFMIQSDHFIEPFSKLVKLRNDNSKYTIFVAEANTYNDTQVGPISIFSPNQDENPDDDWTIAPEFKQYYQYREQHELEIPAGFNSADYVAGELSRQLQQVKGSGQDLIFRATDIDTEQDNSTSDMPLTRYIESTTYKTFTTANEFTMDRDEFVNASNGSASNWWRGWGTIAIKRPELYELGNFINMNASIVDGTIETQFTRLLGCQVHTEYSLTGQSDTRPLVLNIIYNQQNLQYFKNFFDAQLLYPEIWDSFDPNKKRVYGGTTSEYSNASFSTTNTRYLMMNQVSNASLIEIDPTGASDEYIADHTGLGSSLYRDAHAGTNASDRYSKLLLIYHNQADKDKFYDDPTENQFSFGCFRYVNASFNGTTQKFVAVFPHRDEIGLTMPSWFGTTVEVRRKIGYDQHFTGPTTCAICLYNGKKQFVNYYGRYGNQNLKLPDYNSTNPNFPNDFTNYDQANYEQGFLFNRRYIGADDPEITFDGEHFSIDKLHTAENLGNRAADGGRYAVYNASWGIQYSAGSVNDDASDVVYKINPREDINEFCPALLPYRGQLFFYTANGNAGNLAGLQTENAFNYNYQPYQIYDSKSGIFFEDMGYTQNTWEDSLWGILGFSYEQFNGTSNNRQLRVDNNNIQALKYPTTNAEIVTTDTKAWVVNDNGIPLYSDNIPCPFQVGLGDATTGAMTGNDYIQLFPPITQKTASVKLVADNFPRSMLRGYYTIRSDIIADSLFVGGKSNITNMPIVGIVTKENPQNDFYFGTGDVDFTIGKPTRLSSIRVSIHDPNGSYANVDKNSSVIFKIQRQMNVSFNIAEEILASEKGKKKSNL